jgi:quercetin dioxygenase-like cupin family protein
MANNAYIKHRSELQRYTPPDHTGTVNVRLVDKSYTGTFEMILGTIQPGCEAHRHHHDVETQICFVLEGEMEVSLAEDAPVRCGPGTVVAIPPKVAHHVRNCGDKPVQLIVLYSPPLPPRGDVAIGD